MNSELIYNFENVQILDFNPEFFDLWITEVVKSYSKSIGVLSFVFCTDDYLLEMNQKHLNHDYYTDIITFNYNEGDSLSGDLFISYDRITDNAAMLGVSVWDELCRVMIHGVLHLIGFDDKTIEKKKEMREEENRSLLKRNCFT